MLTRRTLATTSALGTLALAAGCTTAQATTDAQVLADASGAVTSLSAVVAQFAAIDPTGLPAAEVAQINSGLNIAKGLIASLSVATPAPSGASTLQQVDVYLNDGLTAVASVLPVASAAFPALMVVVPIVDAIIALLPGIEAWINPILASTQTAPVAAARAPLRAVKTVMTPAQARKTLGIAVMK